MKEPPSPPPAVLPPAGGERRLLADVAALLPNLVKLIGRLLKDSRVPRRSKIALGLAVAYVASPIDVIPEMIPVVGWADDVILLMLAIDSLIQRAGVEVVEEHWDGPGDLLFMIREALGVVRSAIPRRVRLLIERVTG